MMLTLAGILGAILAFGSAHAGERVALEARYEYTTTDGQDKPLRVERGSYRRDSKGRIRTTLSGMVKITDFVSGDRITLHPAERRVPDAARARDRICGLGARERWRRPGGSRF